MKFLNIGRNVINQTAQLPIVIPSPMLLCFDKMKEENVLNYSTLITTFNELIKVGHLELAARIQSILGTNELPKSTKHNRKKDIETSNYIIELTEEEIEIIQNLFLDLEAANVSVKGHTTSLASLYGSYTDIWRNITSHQKKGN